MNVDFEGDIKPTTWTENGFDVILKGKIDRVDKNENYLKVIDYKTGKKEFALSDIVHGINLQMFIYMIMLRNAGIGENCAALYIPAKADYLKVDTPLNDEQAKKERRENVARQGLIRSEIEILEALEHGCTSAPSRWLPLSYDKKQNLKLDSSRVASKDQLERITDFAENKIKEYAKRVTSGDISIMMNSIIAAQHKHTFIYRGWEVHSEGNPCAHAILRGYVNKHGQSLPNYH
jgi:ATP-dependent helicase/DNAse subunit B